MRKVLLLGASALAVGVGSSAAFADDPIKVTLSGTGQEWFGYASNDKSDVGGLSKSFAASNNSFSLNGSTKLDNGITVSVSLSMNASPGTEGSQASLQTANGFTGAAVGLNSTRYAVGTGAPETNTVGFAGGFGSVSIGWQPNVALDAIEDAPSFGVGGLSWGRWAGWVVGGAGNNLVAGSGQDVTYDDYWANKVVYMSPSWSGIQLSASFTPNMAGQDSGPSATSSANAGNWGGDSYAAAITYGGDFGSAKVKAAFAVTEEEFNGLKSPGSGNPGGQGGHLSGYAGSLDVTFGGFTIGASANDRVAGDTPAGAVAAADYKTALATGVTWDVGASYTMGPWGVAVNYYTSEADDNTDTATASGKASDTYYGVDFQYTLGPGITVALENAIVSYKVDPSAAADKNSGWFSVLSTTVNF